MSITRAQRRSIREMAQNCCEYCKLAEEDRFSTFQIDHIIPIKHGGSDDTSNLCLACLKCNGYKGPNVAALDPDTGDATKLFNPREQIWDEHFEVNPDATLAGKTPEARATIAVLRINIDERVKQHKLLIMLGEYPCSP